MSKRIIHFLIGGFLLVGLPLFGIWINDRPVSEYLEFPPLTRYVQHAGFSWGIFVGLALLILVVVFPLIIKVLTAAPQENALSEEGHGFPIWGWIGIVGEGIAWVLAWTRFEWFQDLQIFTFSPLWLFYIVIINAWTQQRCGKCMLTSRPVYLLKLFVVSAVFWWYFEYLNRFVQNWYYVGIEGLSSWQYVCYATLPFATVLPAVLGTYDLLCTFPAFSAGLDRFLPIKVKHPKLLAAGWLLFASVGLLGIGIFPDLLFPLLWVSPLLVVSSINRLSGRETIFGDLSNGNWSRICLLALAALICGFFWETWNYYSLAKWIYSVPFVNDFHVFEMPLLGYSGYLPFGLECAVIAGMIRGKESE